MATLKLLITEKDMRADGTCPISFRIIKDRKILYVSTGYHIQPRYWNGEVKSNHPEFNRLTALLNAKKSAIWKKLMEAEEKNPNITVKQLKVIISSGHSNGDFIGYAEKYIKQFSGNTLKAYKSTLNKIKDFSPVLNFGDLTFEYLRNFEVFLRKKSKPNTIAGRMKHIRALLYAAYKDKQADRNNNPFEYYKIKWNKGDKEYLTDSELQAFRTLEASEEILLARDVFMLQFNLLGMRISDILMIKRSNIKDRILKYRMIKTGEIKSIALTDEALRIIGQDQSKYIFPYIERFGDIGSATSYINRMLKDAGEFAGIKKHLTTHVARHTWASIAIKKIGNPRLIQRALGHSDLKTTEAYMASFSDDEVDAANKIITG